MNRTLKTNSLLMYYRLPKLYFDRKFRCLRLNTYSLEAILSPISLIALELGPMNVTPAFSSSDTNSVFSDKKP